MAAARAVLNGTPAAAGPELEASAAAFGLLLPDDLTQPAAVPPCDVWADHWPAVRLFMAMVTQVRCSFNGVEGFDYTALPVVERRLGIKPKQAAEVFDSLRVMEREFIAWHREG
jgi:hypothetical protein